MAASSTASSSRLLYSVGIGVGVTMISAISYLYYKYYKKDVMPEKWRRVGTLQQLNIFPVKSFAPLKLNADDEIACELLGLRTANCRDRGLMIVDEEDKMVTARVYPKMVLVQTKLEGTSKLLLSAPNMKTDLELDFKTLAEQGPGKDVHTAVWGTHVDAMLCGPKYDAWISQCILEKETGLRLVYYPYPKPVRSINPRMTKEPFITREDTGTFGDATSYMLINLASVEELNTRLQRPVNALQFRGNFHLKMDEDQPFAEDNWGWVKIGDNAVFRSVSPCTRCIFPNINIFTGERDVDGEPLKTLKKYRPIIASSPVLGVHLGLRQPGAVKLNDIIYVEDK